MPTKIKERFFAMKAVSRTVVQLKPGKKSEADEFMLDKSDAISLIEGLVSWGYIYTGENEITVVAVYNDKSSAENATLYVNKLLSDVTPLVAAPPVRNIYNAHWY